jgi:FMN phosphatase YigB (HAD superfamily)
MPLTLLLDLDDTLLNTNLEAFVPAYFQALSRELAPHIEPQLMFAALIAGTRLMNDSQDFSRTLEEVFAAEFYPQLDVPRGDLDAAIENFYDNIFPTLSTLTTQKPSAKPFVEWAISKGHRLAIATDPLLPRKATHHRLRWAGFDPGQFELVSTYDHFHFSKTHPAYYAEVMGRLGWPDGPVLMVGNDMERDIRPARKLGLATYHIDEQTAPGADPITGPHGTLESLRTWLESIDVSTLAPNFQSRDALTAILLSTPAALRGLTRGLDSAGWFYIPRPDDWAMTQLICHLRDTEQEIHHMQIHLFDQQEEPFIPRPDTSVWASQRDYLHEDGMQALKAFVSARRETMELLTNMTPQTWSRTARHAIFGPTNFLEIVGFMADHDRMHVQQAWNMLKKQGNNGRVPA